MWTRIQYATALFSVENEKVTSDSYAVTIAAREGLKRRTKGGNVGNTRGLNLHKKQRGVLISQRRHH